MTKCQMKTQAGVRCSRNARSDSRYCTQHRKLLQNLTGLGDPLADESADSLLGQGWNTDVTRLIALEETGVAGATLDDKLGGSKIAMHMEEVRLIYRDRCCDRAAALGHPVPNRSCVDSDADTTVMTVGDKLYACAIR